MPSTTIGGAYHQPVNVTMNTSKINILIADDDQDDAVMLIEGLTKVLSSFEFATTADGVECLRYLKSSNKPDIVFLDLNMPLKNGIECLRDIQNEQLLHNTPVIVYSTSHNMKDIDASYKYGARFFMVKPSSFNSLAQLLEHAVTMLGRPRTEQECKSNFVIREERLKVAN